MLNVVWWLLTIEAIGLAAFPLAFFLFRRLKDRGYFVSKALGLLLLGYASWMLSILHLVPSVRPSIIALLVVMGGLSGWYAWGRRYELKEFFARERRSILVSEAIFLLFFLGWVAYRAYDPDINHTEQPMDFAFLNASIQSHFGAPEDPWMRGESVSYYYFGYWMMGVTSQLTGIASNISYNLSMALIPALGAMAIFGLVYNMVSTEAARLRYAIIGGCVAAVLLGIAANLEGVLEFMQVNAMGSQAFWDWIRIDGLEGPSPIPTESWRPQDHWWWWNATRVINTFDGGQGIDYTIQEFPFFSFMLGDLHAHVMSIPFSILFLALCFNFLRSPINIWPPTVQRYVSILAIGLALGGLAFTNMWSLPAFAALFLSVIALMIYSARGREFWRLALQLAPVGAIVIGLAFLLFLPYYLTFNSSITGIKPVVAATTRPPHVFIVWGLYLVAVTPFIIGTYWQTIVRADWLRLTSTALLVGFLPYLAWAFLDLQDGASSDGLLVRFFHILPFAILISVAVYDALWLARWREPSGKAFGLVLAAMGLLLIMGPELLFVGDFFGSRMNTVFKLYYQAWILLAAASGFTLYYWSSLREYLSGWKRWATTLWAGAFVVLLVGSLYYPPAAAASKGSLFEGDATLDGLAFVARGRQAEYDAIRFVKKNVPRGSAILEALGNDYSDFGRVSSSTGVPTVINWRGHEAQWRGESATFDTRGRDVATIYQTQDAAVAKTLLDRYDVDYVYVGPRERAAYGTDGLGKFDSFMTTVFDKDDVIIYYRVAR